MKKDIMNYYALIMLLIFYVNNFMIRALRIGGTLYQIVMILFIIINMIILIKFRKCIRYKIPVIIIYFFAWLFAKDFWWCMFGLTNLIVLMGTGFFEGIFIKVISVLIILFFATSHVLILFILIFNFAGDFYNDSSYNDIYENTHYYCDNNYEAYIYSKGAMDSYHFSIGKHYEILDIDDIIYISFNERNETSQESYEEYIENNNCRLVGE